MEIALKNSLHRRFVAATTKCDDTILLYCDGQRQEGSLYLARRDEEQWNTKPLNVSGLNGLQGKRAQMSFGSQRRYVYISSSDAGNDIKVLSSSGSPADYQTDTTLETRFESPVFGMWPVYKTNAKQGESPVFTFVISHAGEVALIDDSGNEPLVFRVKDFELSIEQVLSVSQTESDRISIIGRNANNLHLCIVRFLQLETSASINISCSAPVLISSPSQQATDMSDEVQNRIIDFALKPTCLCVLYEGGYLCFFELQVKDGGTAASQAGVDFFSTPFEQHKKPLSLTAVMYYALVLRPSAPEDKASDQEYEGPGFIKSLWGDFFAVGYGRYISVWDRLYVCGHDYVRVDYNIQYSCSLPASEESFFVSEYGVHELDIRKVGGSGAVSLGMALTRKGNCDDVVDKVAHGLKTAPLRSHPLSTSPIKAAADADSESPKLFEAHVLSEDEREDNIIRQLLTKSKTPTAESVLALVQDYTRRNKGVRHDVHNMGLRRLPSERLAAVTTARCLYELEFGDLKFLVPLVDMLEMGVVSSEAVLAVVDISDSWDMGSDTKPFRMRSMVDPLMQRLQYSHAMEAAVREVGDLPEQDVVKVLRYSTRLADLSSDEERKGDMLSSTNAHSDPLRIQRERARRLFDRCLECRTDTKQAIKAFQRMPFSDVLSLLAHFRAYLSRSTFAPADAQQVLAEPARQLKSGAVDVAFDYDAAVSYRGISNWIERDKFTTKRKRKAGLMKGCISWACNAIDAHLSTLILDESGRELAEQLLHAVKDRRKESEGLKALEGLTGHLANGKGVASGADGLYNRRVVLVPRHVALL